VIRYALICDSGHEFESWFRSSSDYDRQHKRALVACPSCGSTRVEKQIMAPAIASGRKAGAAKAEAPKPVVMAAPQELELRKKLKELRDHVTKNADYVGDQFPELARQMHYEEIAQRSIYGEAKPNEVKELLDEGVEVAPLPVLPEDRN
jgi:hypothetical protein